MMKKDEIPAASFAVIGGSGTLSSDFPKNLPDADVKILAEDLRFETPYGESPAMRLFSVGEKRVLTCRMHGWRSGVTRADAARDDESVEGVGRVIDHDHARGERAAGRGRPQAPVDVVVLASEVQALDLDTALQRLLGQRGPVVGKVRLVADDHDVEALAAQRLGGAQAAQPRAYDDDLGHQAEISMACIGQTSAAAST